MTNVTQMNETDRQYYFMEKASGHVAKLGEELGRRPTCCVTTFGCQMNARDSENWWESWKKSAMRSLKMRMRTL